MYQDDSEQAQAGFSALFGQNGGMQDDDLSGMDYSSQANLEDEQNLSEEQNSAIEAAQDSLLDSSGITAETIDELEQEVTDKAVSGRKAARTVTPGALLVYLLKGHVDREDHPLVFDAITSQTNALSQLCGQLFLKLVIDHDAGYAYVKSLDDAEIPRDQGIKPPRLLIKRQLSFFPSFILILLRQRLLEMDVSGQFGRLVLERQNLVEQVKAYILNANNDIKLTERIEKGIDDLCELGVLKASIVEDGNTIINRIEVKRIINAIVTPEVLSHADEILTSYMQHLKDGGRNKNL